MFLTFSPKASMLMSLCYKQNFIFRLGAVRPAIADCIAPVWKTESPQLRNKVLLQAKEQKQ